jgi:hypothetical protein
MNKETVTANRILLGFITVIASCAGIFFLSEYFEMEQSGLIFRLWIGFTAFFVFAVDCVYLRKSTENSKGHKNK